MEIEAFLHPRRALFDSAELLHSLRMESPILPDVAPELLVERADQLLHLDGVAAVSSARDALALTSDTPLQRSRGRAWWHVALASLRAGDEVEGMHALAKARELYAAHADECGLLMCDDLEAMRLRAQGLLDAAMLLHDRIAGRTDLARAPLDRYVTHNSRGITRNMLGQTDETLLEFYTARAIAEELGWPGPRMHALLNLSAVHGNLYNLHEAKALSQQVFEQAETLQAWTAFGLAAFNLVLALDGLGHGEECGRVVERLLQHQHRLPPWMLPRNLSYVAMAYLAAGDLGQARSWLDRGEGTVFGESDSRTDHARVEACYFLKLGRPQDARDVCQARLLESATDAAQDQPYPRMRLLQAAAEACEEVGDAIAALAHLRQVQWLYAGLVERSSRAGAIALHAAHELTRAQEARRQAEHEQQSLAALNRALELQVAETNRVNESLQLKIAEADTLQKQLREQALRDPLTGLHNRRFLTEAGPARLHSAIRVGAPLCIVLIDIDHFKRVNDVHGHEAGDKLLIALAKLVQRHLRRSDLVCRLGGEEFLLLLERCDPGSAVTRTKTLLAEFSAHVVDVPAGSISGCTFSAGIAELGPDGEDMGTLSRVADGRMYRAKAAGRALVFSGAEDV